MNGRMLGKAGTKRGLAGAPGRLRHCDCGECDMTPSPKAQRAREKRVWTREANDPDPSQHAPAPSPGGRAGTP